MKYDYRVLREGRRIYEGLRTTDLRLAIRADHEGYVIIAPDDYPEENYFAYWLGIPVTFIKRRDEHTRPPLIAEVWRD